MHCLEFTSILKRIRWGGTRLGTVLGKPVGDASDVAESWEVSDHGADQSTVAGGEYNGWTLTELVRRKNRDLFGRHAGLDQFPLLIKFLDARDRLSVQVHPNDKQAVAFDPAERGKTEAWVILDAEPGSQLYAGLRDGVDRRVLEQSIANDGIEECLHRFDVTAGDCVFIPAGTVHAIGEGVLLAEVQQSSDLTFRLYDWDRLGADGKPRPLHIEQALDCIDFSRGPVGPVIPQVASSGGRAASGSHRTEELIRSEYFVMRRHTVRDELVFECDDRFQVFMVLAGAGRIATDGDARTFQLGQTFLMPANAPSMTFVPDVEAVLLQTFLP